MTDLGLQGVEHSSFLIKSVENLFYVRTITLSEKSHVLRTAFSFYFNSSGHIQFLLFSPIEPTQEESCPLSLMTIRRTTNVEQDISILPKEFFDDANQCLSHLLVARRSLSIDISQIEPIGSEIGVSVIVKVNNISKAVFGSEHKKIAVILYIVWRMVVDSVCNESIHYLYPLQIIISRFCGSLLVLQTFCKFCINFLFPGFFTLTGSIKPRENFFFSPYRSVQCFCFHNHSAFIDNACKINTLS